MEPELFTGKIPRLILAEQALGRVDVSLGSLFARQRELQAQLDRVTAEIQESRKEAARELELARADQDRTVSGWIRSAPHWVHSTLNSDTAPGCRYKLPKIHGFARAARLDYYDQVSWLRLRYWTKGDWYDQEKRRMSESGWFWTLTAGKTPYPCPGADSGEVIVDPRWLHPERYMPPVTWAIPSFVEVQPLADAVLLRRGWLLSDFILPVKERP